MDREYYILRQKVVKQVSELLNISEVNAEKFIQGATIILQVIELIDPELYNKLKSLSDEYHQKRNTG